MGAATPERSFVPESAPHDATGRGAAARVLDPDELLERESRARRARLRLSLALAILASTVVLAAIGTGTYAAVERSVRGLRAATLRSTLDVQSKTLEVWIEDQRVAIQRLARDQQVRDHVAALAEIAALPGTTPERYCAAPVRRPLVAELDDAFAGTGAVGFNIIERSGRVIASTFREYCGLKMRPAVLARELDAVFDRGRRCSCNRRSTRTDWRIRRPTSRFRARWHGSKRRLPAPTATSSRR